MTAWRAQTIDLVRREMPDLVHVHDADAEEAFRHRRILFDVLTLAKSCDLQGLNILAYLSAAIACHRRHQAVTSLSAPLGARLNCYLKAKVPVLTLAASQQLCNSALDVPSIFQSRNEPGDEV